MAVHIERLGRRRIRLLGILAILLAVVPSFMALQRAQAVVPPPVFASTFEVTDGNLDHVVLDWTNAPNRQFREDLTKGSGDNTFANGTHEDTVAANVDTDSYPDQKSDLTRSYISYEKVGDDFYMYLAWERKIDPTGNVDLDFEINKQAQGAPEPDGDWPLVRSEGDLLITYELTGGGTVPNIHLRRWIPSGGSGTCEQGAKPCWSRSPGPLASDLAKGSINTNTITDPIPPNNPRTLTPRTFGELGLNLSDLGIFAAGECTSFGSAYVKSRSSGSSFESALQDFVSPMSVTIANCGTVEIIKDVKGGTSSRDFSFTSTRPVGGTDLGTFSLDDDADNTLSNTYTKLDVKPGQYTVTEAATVGWEIDAITCSTGSSGVTATGVATLNVVAGATATCTFVNEDLLPTITVTKSASPLQRTEPGGDFTFTVGVTNTSSEPVTISSMSDAPYGNLLDDAANATIRSSTCSGATIAAGDSISCSFIVNIQAAGDTSHQDTVTVQATDSDGNVATGSASATVNIVDSIPTISVTKSASPASRPEPGGNFTFTVGVTNNSTIEPLTLTSLTDAPFGDVLDDANNNAISGSTCADNTVIAPGATYTCSFVASVTGAPGNYTDTVTATAVDDEGNAPSASASATVAITNVAPTMTVAKSASPSSRPEPGGTFTFTVRVNNTSSEGITITSMVDAPYGDLLDDANNPQISNSTCVDNTTIGAGGSYTCAFDAQVTGPPGLYTDTVTVIAVDDDGSSVTGTASAQVAITDVLPNISISKTPAPASLPEPGGQVTFTLAITNNSTVEAVTVTSLVDDPFGDVLDDAGNPAISGSTCTAATIPAGSSITCSFKASVIGQPGSHVDTVTVKGEDDDGNEASASASATVILTDVLPNVDVTKSADPTVIRSGQSVSYLYTVTTTSAEAVSVEVTDDKCSPVLYVSGDADNDSKLDAGETWRFVCSTSLMATTTNTVTAVATDDDGNSAQDQAQAVVEVIAPVINVDKSAEPTGGSPGTPITYTYIVTVPKEPLTNVKVTDDQCGPVNYVSGDDGDNVLEPGEQWRYTCTRAADGSAPTNVATATGTDRTGATVQATDTVTIAVVEPAIIERVPELPRTGANSGDLAKLAGSLVLFGLTLLFAARTPRRRRTGA